MMVLSVPMSRSELNTSILARFQQALATVTGVALNMVVVELDSSLSLGRRDEARAGYDKWTLPHQLFVSDAEMFFRLRTHQSKCTCEPILRSKNIDRRGDGVVPSSTRLRVQIAVDNQGAAAAVTIRLNPSSLTACLQAEGFPSPTIESLTVIGNAPSDNGSSTPEGLILGFSFGGFMLVLIVLGGLGYGVVLLWRHRWHRTFVRASANGKTGDVATPHHLPLELVKFYCPQRIVGKGTFGCVVQAKLKGSDWLVAIKLVVPGKESFQNYELRQLRREQHMLELCTSLRLEQVVHLADTVHLAAGVENAAVHPHVCWFIMELLEGDSLGSGVKEQHLLGDKECISVARDVFAALKVLHGEGVIHRDIKPDNIMRCRANKTGTDWDGHSFVYKLIDFGTALGVDETVARKEMMTLQISREMGEGTAAYMSPEMFLEPDKVWYPTDLWSLGVSLFEVATGRLPFYAESELAFSIIVAGNLELESPNLLDHLNEDHRSKFDLQLARVLSKAMSKKVLERFSSADEMHEAVYLCLIVRGEAFYSCFISYRVASEAPLARLLFDDSITPGGHRVTVYWDAFRLVKGEDWEEGFATGLLRSLCFLPLLSYGSTAPLSPLPKDPARRAALLAAGWDERPFGRERLEGRDTDAEDNVLKELLVAATLLERRQQGERGKDHLLQMAYPILVGRQEPLGHPSYPGMGSYFLVQGGGCQLTRRPSPPTGRTVATFLQTRGGLSGESASAVLSRSVAWAVESMTRLQGCQLWSHDAHLEGLDLNKEQKGLVGKGCAGPGVDLAGVKLTAEQLESCRAGLDEAQLRMLKAQVHNHQSAKVA